MNISTTEQETTVNFSRTEKKAKVWTSDKLMMTKLDKLVQKDPENWSVEVQKDRDGDIVAKVYTAEKKKLISFRTDRKLSEEQRKKMGDRFRRTQNQNFT